MWLEWDPNENENVPTCKTGEAQLTGQEQAYFPRITEEGTWDPCHSPLQMWGQNFWWMCMAGTKQEPTDP